MRALLTSSPGLGHIHPVVPLARALAGRRHDVCWAVAPEVRHRIEAAGFDVFPAGLDLGPRFAEYRRRYPGHPAEIGPVPANVRVERHVPQTHVSPTCAAVVSHAGSGTFLATPGFGLPQLCLPQAADQFINARQGAVGGAAITLLPGEVSADAVAAAVTRLLDEPAFGDAARVARDEIDAMPGADEVAALVGALV